MDSSQNTTLLNALGAYDSDTSGGGSGSSSPASFIGPDLPPADGSDDESDDESEAAEQTTDEHTLALSTRSLRATDAADHAAYQTTRHNLDVLLGCDQVASTLRLSPEDSAAPSAALQEKFSQWYELRQRGANFNETLMRNRTFRNPNIYRRLVDYLGLEECGSNLSEPGFAAAQLRSDFTPKALADDQERRAREYAERKSAQSAAAVASGTFRRIDFRQPAEPEHPRTAPATGSYVQQMQMRAGGTTGKTFNEALERAKLIAQHLSSRGKGGQ